MRLVDYPMACCGLVTAEEIAQKVPMTGKVEYDEWDGTKFYESVSTDEDWDNHLKTIEQHQLKYRRNCALMTLASHQESAIAVVQRNGWKEVFSFYNPNSGFKVYIYTKVLWENADAYRQAVKEGYVIPPTRGENGWAEKHNPWKEEEHLEWAEENGYVKKETVDAV
jgi:hypothetical protein